MNISLSFSTCLSAIESLPLRGTVPPGLTPRLSLAVFPKALDPRPLDATFPHSGLTDQEIYFLAASKADGLLLFEDFLFSACHSGDTDS